MTSGRGDAEKPLLSPDGRAYWDGSKWVSLVSPDGGHYWNGTKWVSQPRPTRGPSVLHTAFLAALLLLGGAWFLNNTRLGVSIKCQYLNDGVACLQLLVTGVAPTGPTVPAAIPAPATENPAVTAERQRQAAISDAAENVRNSTGDVLSNGDDINSDAQDMSSDADDVQSSLQDVQDAYASLQAETRKKPMNAIQQDDVCVALDDVSVAKDSQDADVDYFEADKETFDSDSSARTGLVGDLSSALASLRQLDGANPAWTQVLNSGDAALSPSAGSVTSATSTATDAQTRVSTAEGAARKVLTDGKSLAATVAQC